MISAAEDREVRFGETPKPTPETDVLPGKRNASTRLHSFRRGKQDEAATMITLRVNLGPFFEEFDIKKIADCEGDPRTRLPQSFTARAMMLVQL